MIKFSLLQVNFFLKKLVGIIFVKVDFVWILFVGTVFVISIFSSHRNIASPIEFLNIYYFHKGNSFCTLDVFYFFALKPSLFVIKHLIWITFSTIKLTFLFAWYMIVNDFNLLFLAIILKQLKLHIVCCLKHMFYQMSHQEYYKFHFIYPNWPKMDSNAVLVDINQELNKSRSSYIYEY